MINNFLEPELRSRRINNRNVWVQQDGATAHTVRAAMAVVRAMFPDRLISQCGDVPWPQSPDLSMCDFFLWGYLKSRVYEGKPRTLEELKGAICKQIGMINQELLESRSKLPGATTNVHSPKWWSFKWCNFSYINSLKWHVITYHFVILNKFYTKN